MTFLTMKRVGHFSGPSHLPKVQKIMNFRLRGGQRSDLVWQQHLCHHCPRYQRPPAIVLDCCRSQPRATVIAKKDKEGGEGEEVSKLHLPGCFCLRIEKGFGRTAVLGVGQLMTSSRSNHANAKRRQQGPEGCQRAVAFKSCRSSWLEGHWDHYDRKTVYLTIILSFIFTLCRRGNDDF